MGKLASFLALDGADRWATFEALFDLAVAQLRVRLVPPRKWRSSFGPIAAGGDLVALDPDAIAPVRRVRLAVLRATRNLPTDPNCLPQALAARRMLERRGIASSLFLGAERDADGKPRFHAWLKVGPEWVTGLCDESRYTLLVPGEAEPA
ncbi:lasso peptide biosynthesis B2 protein [Erythrobacter mangrovi]|uniref:Lasso peptide biosynthesis B2 protein n=1 Tax=Erythrobacter mangrovi TaxID=2739433 RepID=A0A7D3XK70_9SPHN|nr:lasso peptide biosynthesis B2 protein [Erythrobacter mangrovi]QKG72459.1 lasso peptide biosynthesis B2 protein [Erythrobacter mangrovi]